MYSLLFILSVITISNGNLLSFHKYTDPISNLENNNHINHSCKFELSNYDINIVTNLYSFNTTHYSYFISINHVIEKILYTKVFCLHRDQKYRCKYLFKKENLLDKNFTQIISNNVYDFSQVEYNKIKYIDVSFKINFNNLDFDSLELISFKVYIFSFMNLFDNFDDDDYD